MRCQQVSLLLVVGMFCLVTAAPQIIVTPYIIPGGIPYSGGAGYINRNQDYYNRDYRDYNYQRYERYGGYGGYGNYGAYAIPIGRRR